MSGAIPFCKALADLASRPVEEQAEVLRGSGLSPAALVAASGADVDSHYCPDPGPPHRDRVSVLRLCYGELCRCCESHACADAIVVPTVGA